MRRMGLILAALAVSACASRRTDDRDVTPVPTLESRLAKQLHIVLDRAIADSAFPGAYAVVGNAHGILAQHGVGRLDALDPTVPDSTTLWDLASLTKVVVTTTLLMNLVDQGRVVLDSPAVRYLPTWKAPGAERVTVRDLLAHRSGLPAWRPLWKETGDAASARLTVLESSPVRAIGSVYEYSDIGFIILGLLVEHVAGDSLHHVAERVLFGPLGMIETSYRPTRNSRIAQTELDAWRGRKLRGEVHDENAYRLDGVSGHAGLFSTGADLARFARTLLRRGELDGQRFLPDSIVRQFTALQDSSVSHRALGWEKPNQTNSGGHFLSRSAFGHTGFTGTSIWIDPEQDLFMVLLTNRVNPSRENRRISGVRIEMADSVVSAFRATSSARFLEGGAKRH